MQDTDRKTHATIPTQDIPPGRWYNAEGGFFQLPRALRYDDRLSHAQRVVLMTIASHIMLKDEAFPSRKAIREFTGMDIGDITAHTNALERFGWVYKDHVEGQAVHYLPQVPGYAIERMREVQAAAKLMRDLARTARAEARAKHLVSKPSASTQSKVRDAN